MAESDDIQLVVTALRTVPETRLRLIELANRIPLKNGDFDLDVVAELAEEINLARVEAAAYGAATVASTAALLKLQGQTRTLGMEPATEEDLLQAFQF